MRKLGFLTLTFGLLLSCSLDPDCTWEDLYVEFEGYDFESNLGQTNIILLGPSADPTIDLYEGYIIRSDSAYDDLTEFSKDQGCTNCNYPDIDFDQYTLVGYATESSCLAVNYVKLTSTDDGWRYALKTVDQTQCNVLNCDNFSYNWILLPKAADTAEFTFEFGLARYFCDC